MFIEFANKTIRVTAVAICYRGSNPKWGDEGQRNWVQVSFDDPTVVDCLKEYYPTEALAQARYEQLRELLLKVHP